MPDLTPAERFVLIESNLQDIRQGVTDAFVTLQDLERNLQALSQKMAATRRIGISNHKTRP